MSVNLRDGRLARRATLVFCVREGEVLLAKKKRGGFGTGKWNGYGGTVEDGESNEICLIRELREEAGISADIADLIPVGLINFHFAGRHEVACATFLLKVWEGEPCETEEMDAPQWFPFDALPYEEMWVSDRHWLPQALMGKQVSGDVYFNHDGFVLEEVRLSGENLLRD